MEIANKSKTRGCLILVLVGIGFVLILSPLNPFVKWEKIGEEEYLTDFSWIMIILMLFVYGYVVFKLLINRQ